MPLPRSTYAGLLSLLLWHAPAGAADVFGVDIAREQTAIEADLQAASDNLAAAQSDLDSACRATKICQ